MSRPKTPRDLSTEELLKRLEDKSEEILEDPIIEYKNILINLYQSYIEKFGDKVYEIISQYNLKNEVKEILVNKKNIQDLILNDNYIVTNLDIILLSQYFDTPVILLSSKGFFENASNIIKTKNSFFYYIILKVIDYSVTAPLKKHEQWL